MSISIPQSAGIYIIKCEKNGKIYVGSSINLKRRWKEHRTELDGKRHSNPHLQNAWNKYGARCFKFIVLEVCAEEKVIEREQHWLDTLRPYDKTKGFNIAIDANAPLRGRDFSPEHRKKIGDWHRGRKSSPESIERMRQTKTGVPRGPMPEETKRKISLYYTGRKKQPQQIEKMADTKRKEYIIIYPDGTEVRIKGLRRFCADKDLDDGALIKVAQGKQKAHKGFKCRYVESSD